MDEGAEPAAVRQVLRGLALNRVPGWNFPGNFLELSFDDVAAGSARLSVEPGAHAIGADGQAHLAVLAILADIGMGVSMRRRLGLANRMATVSMTLQFTGAARIGRLDLESRTTDLVRDVAVPLGLTQAEVRAGGELVCRATGSFVELGNREGLAPLPMRRRGIDADPAVLQPGDLTADEREVYERAAAATREPVPSFIERFWGLLPQRTAEGASCRFANGLHVGNRVGHTQGGLTFALAAVTANAACGEGWQLAGASASYLRPGTGEALQADAVLLHAGRLTAVVRTEVRDPDGRIVLDSVSQHARRV